MIDSTTLYERVKASGIEHGSHESDLYVKVTPESRALIAEYKFRTNVETFRNQIDGTPWFDVPFAYQPFWQARTKKAQVAA